MSKEALICVRLSFSYKKAKIDKKQGGENGNV